MYLMQVVHKKGLHVADAIVSIPMEGGYYYLDVPFIIL